MFRSLLTNRPSITAALLFNAWLVCFFDWMWLQQLPELLTSIVLAVVSLAALAAIASSIRKWRSQPVFSSLVVSACWFPLWHSSVVLLDVMQAHDSRVRMATVGTGATYLLGLLWVVWFIERAARHFTGQRRAVQAQMRVQQLTRTAATAPPITPVELVDKTSNPLDPDAWYYGRRSKRLNQSLLAFSSYSLLFYLAFLVMTNVGGCQEAFELPAGGGEQQQIAQQVKVQKVIRKKFVVNPFAAINFKVPPIDEIKLQFTELTEHAYTVGFGAGSGAGYGGTKRVPIRFIRLEYLGGDWDQDFGIGADVNMLIEFGIRVPGHKVSKTTESRTVGQLANFKADQAPPFLYMTGQKNIEFSKSEIRILREYLLDRHGMLFADNGGSNGWHNQFVARMREILPNVRPTPVPLDDVIHRVPFQIPFLPYVAPHGGKEALGWRVDGRLVCYYHPGDIGDAWADDHAGVSPEIWNACYALGANVINYAYMEHAKWRAAQQEKR